MTTPQYYQMREQIRSFYIRSQRLLDRFAGQLGLSARQMGFLMYIAEQSDVRHIDLINAFRISPGAATNTIDDLEVSGYIRRVTNPTDRRNKLLQLTPSGQGLLSKIGPISNATQVKLFSILTDTERSQLQTILAKLDNRLSDLEFGAIELLERRIRQRG